MSSVVISGDTSGAITLSAPAVAGTNTITLPASTGTVVTTGSPATGNVIQVVSSLYSTTSSVASTTPAATGLTATITPKFSTSKIYLSVSSSGGQTTAGRSGFFYIYKNGSSIAKIETGDGTSTSFFTICLTYLDSPATTSATTYAIYIATDGVGTNYFAASSSPSTMTLMEIAG